MFRLLQIARVFKNKIWYSLLNPGYLLESTVRGTNTETLYDTIIEPIVSQPSLIVNNIYIGSAFNAADKEWLRSNSITTIINATNEISNFYPDEFNYYNFPTDDTEKGSLVNFFEKFCNVVNRVEYNNGILVHCYAGRSRSVILVLYYLITRCNMTRNAALDLIYKKRPQTNINVEFLRQCEISTIRHRYIE
jgi:protein-tyrosine phosphatase